jgi:hypothetical protein
MNISLKIMGLDDTRFEIQDAGQIMDDLIPICFLEENVLVGDMRLE